jgi:undecaprenyl-phosphate 4-deoxy-4-formamido-L-arabinose transferase
VHFKGISIVVPVYNSHQTLEPLVSRLEAVLSELADDFEIILVNDDSKDDSWRVIEKLVDMKRFVRGFSLMRNYGQHNALLAGIRLANYEVIVTIDDDLQHPPEEIPKLLEKLNDGFDVVYGTADMEQHGLWRNLASKITKVALSSVINVKIAPRVSAFRVFRTCLRDSFVDYRGAFPSIDVLLGWGTNRFGAVSVRHQLREKGRSNYTFAKLVTHAINMITGFSTLPLRIASILGFTFTLFGFFVLAYVLIRYLIWGSPVAGFPFLASTIAIFSGAQLFAIGIIGEYLARMYIRMMDRPGYVIREKREHQNQ